MRRVLGALAFGLLAFAPIAAHAQTAEPNASVGALARELIAQSNAEGVFEPLPSEQAIVLRHRRSGLVCRLEPGHANRLIIFPQAARGEDVACDTSDGTESVTLYATRFSFEPTLDELMEGAVAAIHRRFPDAREVPAPTAAAATAGQPASRSAQFMLTRDGAPTYSRVTVAFVAGWAIKLRYNLTASDAAAARRGEAAANAIWNATLSELTRRGS